MNFVSKGCQKQLNNLQYIRNTKWEGRNKFLPWGSAFVAGSKKTTAAGWLHRQRRDSRSYSLCLKLQYLVRPLPCEHCIDFLMETHGKGMISARSKKASLQTEELYCCGDYMPCGHWADRTICRVVGTGPPWLSLLSYTLKSLLNLKQHFAS